MLELGAMYGLEQRNCGRKGTSLFKTRAAQLPGKEGIRLVRLRAQGFAKCLAGVGLTAFCAPPQPGGLDPARPKTEHLASCSPEVQPHRAAAREARCGEHR